MSSTIKELKDKNNNPVYPVTKAEACYLRGGVDTVERVLNDMEDQDTTIQFGTDSISKTLASGSTVDTVFTDDGSIRETTKDKNGTVLQTKVITFQEDGSISIKIS